jgi:hypothetical protein
MAATGRQPRPGGCLDGIRRVNAQRSTAANAKKKNGPHRKKEGEGRKTCLDVRIASARKSPLAHVSSAHYGRISHHSRSGQRNRMLSHGSCRMKPESNCSRPATHIQAGQEPTMRTLTLDMTNGPAHLQPKGSTLRSRRSSDSSQKHVRWLLHTCPPYRDEKHTTKHRGTSASTRPF